MVLATSPDGISYWTSTDLGGDIPTESSTQATSVQNALNKRQRYTYGWANASARTGQTGMTTGSTGYQIDTKTEYIYEGGVWRLATPYCEFVSPDTSVTNSVFTNMGALSIDATNSTSTTFATSTGSDNKITFAQPGIYNVGFYAVADAAMGATVSFVLASTVADPTDGANQLMRAPFAADNVAGLAIPALLIPSANYSIYFYYRQNSAGTRTIHGRMRVARIG